MKHDTYQILRNNAIENGTTFCLTRILKTSCS
uniref:Putative LRR receptor-like serine/threonine-protein kinase At1g56130 n=1 Tax=Rhizophora mucronata TaxID=61149 RepID=A0A2P2MEL2_RHIMU